VYGNTVLQSGIHARGQRFCKTGILERTAAEGIQRRRTGQMIENHGMVIAPAPGVRLPAVGGLHAVCCRFQRTPQEQVQEWDSDGFQAPMGWSFVDFSQQQTTPMCLFVVRWDDSRNEFLTAGDSPNCWDSVDWIPWDPAQ
jgi:hypothetical protein